jgi:hypothetical protein
VAERDGGIARARGGVAAGGTWRGVGEVKNKCPRTQAREAQQRIRTQSRPLADATAQVIKARLVSTCLA